MKKIYVACLSLVIVFLVACTTDAVDDVKPIILVTGGTNVLVVGDTFVAPSVVVSDNVDQDLEVIISGDQVNVNQPGTYTILYNAVDTSGNHAVEKQFTVTIYAYQTNMDIVNGGFETGDLSGWMIEEINGSSDAFSDAFVIDTANRKEGTYFFDGSVTDDDKTGALKSSNFVLGGTGWIHFKLGGGNDIDTLYLGVYRASDDSLVAKFANTNPQKYGGNEILVGYKYNLLNIDGVNLGDVFYIKVIDTKLENWGIIKLDDIKTFHITEPASNNYELASNQA